MESLEQIKGSRRVTAQIDILWDWDSWVAAELDGRPSTLVDYFRAALRVALLDLGYRVDIVSSQHDISPYTFVIAPILYLINDAVKLKIHEFVGHGGHFVTTYFSGIVGTSDRVILGGYPGAFRNLLGIRIEQWAPLLEDDTAKLDDGSLGTIWSEAVDIVGEHVMRMYADGELDGLPAVKMYRHARGTATHVSMRLGNSGLAILLPDVLNAARLDSPLSAAHRGKVEPVVRSDGETEWGFIINRTGDVIDVSEMKEELMLGTGREKEDCLDARGVAVYKRAILGLRCIDSFAVRWATRVLPVGKVGLSYGCLVLQ